MLGEQWIRAPPGPTLELAFFLFESMALGGSHQVSQFPITFPNDFPNSFPTTSVTLSTTSLMSSTTCLMSSTTCLIFSTKRGLPPRDFYAWG